MTVTANSAKESTVQVNIVGAGLAGLVLALALKTHCPQIQSQVFEQAPRFEENVGGAIGLYANGQRVLRDISPALLEKVRANGYPYVNRRWMRHDGTEVACAKEAVLAPQEEHLQSIGIRRWKLQNVLMDFARQWGIPVHFDHRLISVVAPDLDTWKGKYRCVFAHAGSNEVTVDCDVVFGADGVKSKVREALFGPVNPPYTGVTCLMGAAPIPRPYRGICFPSSQTSKCHACYYPTGPNETVFQIFFPTEERPETWGPLSKEEARKECQAIAQQLKEDGWHDDFIQPILKSEGVIRVGLRAREPLKQWVRGRCVLLGDAAHPPVPYIGQGAMMAFEDVGVLTLIFKNMCVDKRTNQFSLDRFDAAMKLYQSMRVSRTAQVLGASHVLGKMQQDRADSALYNWFREWGIWLQVKYHGTLPIMFQGSKYHYNEAVRDELVKAKL